MNSLDHSAPSSDRSTSWMWALAAICLGIVAYGLLYSSNTESDPAFLFGYNLPIAAFVWALFAAAALKKKSKGERFFAFAAIFLSLIAGGILSAAKHKQGAVEALTSIQQEMGRIANTSVDAAGVPMQIDRISSTAPKASGEFGELERFMKEYFDSLVVLRNEYLLELNAIGWPSLLDSRRLAKDTTLSESKVMLERAKLIAAKYEKKNHDFLEGMKTRIKDTNVSDSTKQEMLAGFERGMKQGGRQKLDEMWKLEKQAIAQFDHIFLLLSARKNWVVQGDQILFNKEEDLTRYNSYLAAINQLVERQRQLEKDNFAALNRNLESLKH